MERKSSRKTKFITSPTIDPRTGNKITIGSKQYKQLVERYGEPNKIISPKTGSKINIGKGEYKKLIKQGYTDDELLYGTKSVEQPTTLVPKDILYNILLQSDVETLNNLCRTNKEAETLCKSVQFWMDKMNNDNLPIYEVKNKKLSKLKIYEETVKAVKRTNDTLTINKIEATRSYNKTNGSIHLFTNGEYEKITDIPSLPQILIDDIVSQLEDSNNDFNFNSIILKYIDDNTYNIKCIVLDNITENFYEAETTININTVKNIMNKFIFDMYTGYGSMECNDENDIPFIFEDEFNIGDYEGNRPLFFIRRGIWEALNYK